jgi:predicted phosphodiesterase
VLHCGDLVAPSTLHAIVDLGLPIHLIHGNNAGDLFHLSRLAQDHGNRVQYYGQDGSLDLAQRRIFMVHYPHYAKAMALTGDYDLVCNGHEHRAVIERIRNVKGEETLRIDPGTVAGVSGPGFGPFLFEARPPIRVLPRQGLNRRGKGTRKLLSNRRFAGLKFLFLVPFILSRGTARMDPATRCPSKGGNRSDSHGA